MAAVFGERPPWHDVQAMIRGPAVGDVEAVFRERWDDPVPITLNPVSRLHDLLDRQDDTANRLPGQQPDPQPCGDHAVQLLRTYPFRRPGYSFAPKGERSIARGYLKVLARARSLIYLEDQYLWSAEVVDALARALAERPELRLIAVIPRYPDQDGSLSMPPNLIGRVDALRLLRRAGGGRVAIYGLENEAGTPVYVHAKVCVVDDTWAIIGSDNFNRRSWTHDSELSCAVLDLAGQRPPDRGREADGGTLELPAACDPGPREHRAGPGSRAQPLDSGVRGGRRPVGRSRDRGRPRATLTDASRRLRARPPSAAQQRASGRGARSTPRAPPTPMTRSGGRPRNWTPGTRTAGAARGRPASCVTTTRQS